MWRNAMMTGFSISFGLTALILISGKVIKFAVRLLKRETWAQRLRRELGFKEDQL